jgi:hypothetical protein
LSNIVESRTDIQIDVPLTDEAKLKCSREMIDAMNAISSISVDIKDYLTEKKKEIDEYADSVAKARAKMNMVKLSDEEKMATTMEIVNLLDAISQVEDDLKSYQTEKKAEIAKCEAIVNIARTKISRGKETKWVNVKLLRDFDKKKKSYIALDTGEIVKVLSMTEDDMQMELVGEGLAVQKVK